ncbi:MAG: biotin--[acetyl-CoA-carboxylase] ligase [Oscillospiraceae bacterium]|nr:biotin--[acetyl-CoA-carboxylase] ligase [Oscillospiraceae bacterium]
MSKEAILRLLVETDDYVSGEGMSEALGVSRAAIWKSIRALREAGYEIEARTNRGYRLLVSPDTPLPEAIRPLCASEDLCREIIYLDAVDSTNTYLKREAASGAPHGTVAIAGEQTGGRGRMGRPFISHSGKGLFFSILLRPEAVLPASITSLTAFAAVAVCEAIEAVAPIKPKVKWVNDILVGDRKLVGILSEMSMLGESGQVDYVVIGVGVNVHYQAEDFPEEIRDRATSLAILTDTPQSRAKLAAALIDAFSRMYKVCQTEPETYVDRYRARSATVGREILVLRGEESLPALATGIAPDCGLIVRYPDGGEETLFYGETSIRTERGYV